MEVTVLTELNERVHSALNARGPSPLYTTDAEFAFAAIEQYRHMTPEASRFTLKTDRYDGAYSNGKWVASFQLSFTYLTSFPFGDDVAAQKFWNEDAKSLPIAAADTPALAMCRLIAKLDEQLVQIEKSRQAQVDTQKSIEDAELPDDKLLTNKIPARLYWQMQQMKYWGRMPIREQLERALEMLYAQHAADADKPLPEKEKEKLLKTKKPRK
ncbi:hypothetical protein [Hymenobacter glacieicola]|uniref:Uncharacterized protein n=1 Tax=Hymenobacter glacieicola TaxID=1562124 RepID=A0ABQ1X5U0_9BACT|nr:hypothetical protein [Hymenobacter glacieicola]GGG61308.1 hypothetical protein GCM10011378_41670 [Hymenobacter glacieicola]